SALAMHSTDSWVPCSARMRMMVNCPRRMVSRSRQGIPAPSNGLMWMRRSIMRHRRIEQFQAGYSGLAVLPLLRVCKRQDALLLVFGVARAIRLMEAPTVFATLAAFDALE